MLAADFTFANLFFGVFGIFVTVTFLWIFVTILADVFRSADMGGWGKAIWVLVLVVLPFIGSLIYLVARGDRMADRYMQLAVERVEQASAATETDAVGRLSALADMKQMGLLSDEEFERMKRSVLAST